MTFSTARSQEYPTNIEQWVIEQVRQSLYTITVSVSFEGTFSSRRTGRVSTRIGQSITGQGFAVDGLGHISSAGHVINFLSAYELLCKKIQGRARVTGDSGYNISKHERTVVTVQISNNQNIEWFNRYKYQGPITCNNVTKKIRGDSIPFQDLRPLSGVQMLDIVRATLSPDLALIHIRSATPHYLRFSDVVPEAYSGIIFIVNAQDHLFSEKHYGVNPGKVVRPCVPIDFGHRDQVEMEVNAHTKQGDSGGAALVINPDMAGVGVLGMFVGGIARLDNRNQFYASYVIPKDIVKGFISNALANKPVPGYTGCPR